MNCARGLLVLAISSALNAGLCVAQGIDRSMPPALDTSTGGFTITRLSAPVVIDGQRWIAAQPYFGGEHVVNATSGQFAVMLRDPNDSGDVRRFRATFRELGRSPVSLTPDAVSWALLADNRWILLESLDVIDTRAWRRYSLAKQSGIAPHASPVAVSADGQRVVIARRDCALDCADIKPEYSEIRLPARPADAASNDPVGALVRRLAATNGMWTNGIFTPIKLPATAPIPQVLQAAIETNRYDGRRATVSRIISTRQVRIDEFPNEPYTAVLVETDLGRKIALLRSTQQGWWSRVYDE